MGLGSVFASPHPGAAAGGITCEMIPVHRHPHWRGKITRLRAGFDNPAPGATNLGPTDSLPYLTFAFINPPWPTPRTSILTTPCSI
jgi:hypothetical protein